MNDHDIAWLKQRLHPRRLAILFAAAFSLGISMIAIERQYVRYVEAEDDCPLNIWAVERLPVVGLVCIGERY